jgi:hypothetical protein
MPDLKRDTGPVAQRLKSLGADEATLDVWAEFVRQDIQAEDENYDVPS